MKTSMVPRMAQIEDHPVRQAALNELHARPFPTVEGACDVAFLAYKFPSGGVGRDRGQDVEFLNALLQHHGLPRLKSITNHYYEAKGDLKIKWESHTEFNSFTILKDRGPRAKPMEDAFSLFPEAWLAELPGQRIASVLLDVSLGSQSKASIVKTLRGKMSEESAALSEVLDGAAIVASDFQVGSHGHSEMFIVKDKNTGAQRVGRIAQRLLEIEAYKTMSFLALPRARSLGVALTRIEGELTGLVARIKADTNSSEAVLDKLLDISAELESLIALHDYRFSATRAYSKLVDQRVEVLREERIASMQTFQEFLMRRFAPAMRTVEASERRLNALAARTARAAELLRTRVEVQRSQQNQEVLRSMDRRANLQLRLQKTVEGLSVVAISYYAVNLLAGLLGPANAIWGIPKYWIVSGITIPVVLIIWWIVGSIRKKHLDD